MNICKKLIALFFVMSCISNYSYSQDEVSFPRVIIDISEMALRVDSVKQVQSIAVESGKIKPSRRDAKLIEVKIMGKSTQDGFVTLYPNSFGLQYLYKNVNRLSMSIACGIKFIDPMTGEVVEKWNTDLNSSINLGVSSKEDFKIWFVCEVPKEVEEFYVLVPSLLDKKIATN